MKVVKLIAAATMPRPASPSSNQRGSRPGSQSRTAIAATSANALSSSIRKSRWAPTGDEVPLSRASWPSAQSST